MDFSYLKSNCCTLDVQYYDIIRVYYLYFFICICFWQVCDVVDRVLKHPMGKSLVKDLHPEFEQPKKPFLRMTYSDAIEYLKENNITKEDGTFYEFGEVRTVLV